MPTKGSGSSGVGTPTAKALNRVAARSTRPVLHRLPAQPHAAVHPAAAAVGGFRRSEPAHAAHIERDLRLSSWDPAWRVRRRRTLRLSWSFDLGIAQAGGRSARYLRRGTRPRLGTLGVVDERANSPRGAALRPGRPRRISAGGLRQRRSLCQQRRHSGMPSWGNARGDRCARRVSGWSACERCRGRSLADRAAL
jgi:hypothetical protein